MIKAVIQAGVAIAVAMAVAPAMAQAGDDARQAPAEAQAAGTVDPAAIAALEKMGKTLRELDHFYVDSQSSLELVLDSGQKIEMDTEVAYRVKKPDKLYAELKDGRKDRKFYYDGHDFTMWAPGLNYYAKVSKVEKDLRQLFVDLGQDYGVEIPLADLFYWGTEYAPVSAITSAFEVGPMVLSGDEVDQYAYSQGDTDWQLWISRATSLPRKVVITSRADPAMPEFTAFLHWDTKAAVDDAVFKFDPPSGAAAIEFAKLDAASDAKKEESP